MKKEILDLKKASQRKRQNRGKGGKIVILIINTTSLPDQLEAGVDYVTSIDSQGNIQVMCQKWLRDDSDSNPTKLPDGPATALNLSNTNAAAIMAAIDGVINPLIVAQFGAQTSAVASATTGTPVIAAAATIQLGSPSADDNATNPGANYPLTIAGGTGTNAVALQYAQNGGAWTTFGNASNVADGVTPLDAPNPSGVTGLTQIQAVLTVEGVNYTSNAITVTF